MQGFLPTVQKISMQQDNFLFLDKQYPRLYRHCSCICFTASRRTCIYISIVIFDSIIQFISSVSDLSFPEINQRRTDALFGSFNALSSKASASCNLPIIDQFGGPAIKIFLDTIFLHLPKDLNALPARTMHPYNYLYWSSTDHQQVFCFGIIG